MLFDDDDDAKDKTPLVSPNEVLNIEISPIVEAKATSWLNGFNSRETKSKYQSYTIVTKQRRPKRLRNSGTSLRQLKGEMKRGDPFLPSVMTDENPIVEYSTKKTIVKKPSDCKCKGMGYNCSPSAVLPEEMRQQWGCGVLGKATPTRSNDATLISKPIAPCGNLSENSTLLRTTLCGSSCSFSASPKPVPVSRAQTNCWECKAYPCQCFGTAPKNDTFSVGDNDERRKQKRANKGSCFKSKGNKTRLLINAISTPSTVKRNTCFNKENNIISTSNFSKDTVSPFNSLSEESGYFYESKYNPTIKSSTKTRSDPYRDRIYMTSGSDYGMNTPRILSEDTSFTPVSRYRHHFRSNRPSSTNMAPSAMTNGSGPFSDARMFDLRPQRLPLSSKQMYLPDPQACYCERCKRRSQLLSKMEALGFPSSSAHPKLSPYSHPPQQRYTPSSMPYSSHSSNRYLPYTPYPYAYPSMSDTGSFTSPEISSPIDDDPALGGRGDNLLRPLLSQSTATDPFAYLDTDQMLESPLSSSGTVVDDITDLSVKDTVDFFLGLKSPLTDALSLSDESFEPADQNEAFGSSLDIGDFSIESGSSLSVGLPEETSDDAQLLHPFSPQPEAFGCSGREELQTAPMSQLYSSLISDLEDELKCAIENIPVE